jgi:hypothetical protein
MTKKADFAAEEWNELRAVPAIVSAAVSSADPSGLFGALKEAAGGTRGMIESLKAAQSVELAAELLSDRSFPGLPDPKELTGEGSRNGQMANLRRNAIAKAQSAVAMLGSKATPEEASAYRGMLIRVAEAVASAAKEGGFLGLGGERVSTAEQDFLDELKGSLKA